MADSNTGKHAMSGEEMTNVRLT